MGGLGVAAIALLVVDILYDFKLPVGREHEA